jgi:hypothetical protein
LKTEGFGVLTDIDVKKATTEKDTNKKAKEIGKRIEDRIIAAVKEGTRP